MLEKKEITTKLCMLRLTRLATALGGLKEREIFLLGRWCFGPNLDQLSPSKQLIPYHWDDRQKLRSDSYRLRCLYEQALEVLARCLGNYHGVTPEVKYWRIILGPWLGSLVPVYFDRREMLERALKLEKITHIELPVKKEIVSSADMGEFSANVADDSWNLSLFDFIYGQIKGDSASIECRVVECCNNKNKKELGFIFYLKVIFNYFVNCFFHIINMNITIYYQLTFIYIYKCIKHIVTEQ